MISRRFLIRLLSREDSLAGSPGKEILTDEPPMQFAPSAGHKMQAIGLIQSSTPR